MANALNPLESLYISLEATREALTGGVALPTGEGAPTDTMGADAEELRWNPTDDADADMPMISQMTLRQVNLQQAVRNPADREKRESFIRLAPRRLAETLSTQSKKKKGLTEVPNTDLIKF